MWLWRWSRWEIILPISLITPFALPVQFVFKHIPFLPSHSSPFIPPLKKKFIFNCRRLLGEKQFWKKFSGLVFLRKKEKQHFCFFGFLSSSICFLLLPVLHTQFSSEIKGRKRGNKTTSKLVFLAVFSVVFLSSLFPPNNGNIPS